MQRTGNVFLQKKCFYKVDPPGNMAQKLKMQHVLMCTGIIFGNKKRRRKNRTFSNAADFGNMQDTESDIIAIWCQLFHYCDLVPVNGINLARQWRQ